MPYGCYKFNQEFTWARNYGILEALLLLCDSWVFPFRKKMKGGGLLSESLCSIRCLGPESPPELPRAGSTWSGRSSLHTWG